VAANRKYKDSVFNSFLSDKAKLLEIYNVIENGNYDNNTELVINTMTDVLYMDRINDISFIIDRKLVVLIEHQSTINNNMPLRLLFYISRLYEKMVDDRSIYRRNRISIPKPNFIVLYNGDEDYPENKILKLSESFEDVSIPNLLELEVKVYNINKGKNEDILKRSRSLNDYTTFIARVKENKNNGMDIESAISEAIEYCIKEDIMREFLESKRSEVKNMLYTEFNIEEAKKVWWEEAQLSKAENIALRLVKMALRWK
jgi:hypothetical protein